MNGLPTQPTGGFEKQAFARVRAGLEQSSQSGVDPAEAITELTTLEREPYPGTAAAAALLGEVDAVARRLNHLATAQPVDTWQLRETVEQAAEVLRVMHTESLRARLEAQPNRALRFVDEALSGLPERDIALLLGTETSQVAVWRHEGVPQSRANRVGAVAQILLELQSSMTADGMMVWFSARRTQLDGRTPLEMLDRVGGQGERLRRLARTPHSVLAA